jgi:lysyl-tRNA synthetase class 2
MLQVTRHTDRWSPRLIGLATLLVGLINIASALTPNIRWRGHLLLRYEPVADMRLFHALALPAGAALLLVSLYLLKRRQRAWQAALALMLALGLINLLKGLDFEETIFTWTIAGALWVTRGAFRVYHEPITARSALWRVPLLGLGATAFAAVVAWATQGRPSVSTVLRETGDLLTWTPGPMRFTHHHLLHAHFAWIPLGVHIVEIGTLLTMAYVIFRPLAAPHALPGDGVRQLAAEVVREHGTDTLSFFKLREDKHYLFSADGQAFVGYRVEAGVMLLSGDPVGPREQFPELLRVARAYAAARGLKFGVLGASKLLAPLLEEMGMITYYLGDEAIIDTGKFSLEGRPIRKVRQSVTRLGKAGYTAEIHDVGALDAATLEQVERVIELGRMGAPERGFSMAMASIQGRYTDDTPLILARDEEGTVRGVLHFVPVYGRSAVSLSSMRRDPETPNGLTEFLVCKAIELLRDRGVEELSLNFATAAKYLHSPEGALERAFGKLASVLNPYFQIESLYKFNAKFFPRWEPRYVAFEGWGTFPRAFLAAMWAEGQIGKPRLPARVSPRRVRGATEPA